MSDEYTYEFWGVTADGKRELITTIKARGIGQALAMKASLGRLNPMPDYPRMEILRVFTGGIE